MLTPEPAPIVIAELGACPPVAFNALVDGWDPVVKNVQGGGSGLPGNHIGGTSSYMNIFGDDSLFGPRVGDPIEIDGFDAIRGVVEGGLGVSISIDAPDCEFFDLHFFGPTEAQVTSIIEGIEIG